MPERSSDSKLCPWVFLLPKVKQATSLHDFIWKYIALQRLKVAVSILPWPYPLTSLSQHSLSHRMRSLGWHTFQLRSATLVSLKCLLEHMKHIIPQVSRFWHVEYRLKREKQPRKPLGNDYNKEETSHRSLFTYFPVINKAILGYKVSCRKRDLKFNVLIAFL